MRHGLILKVLLIGVLVSDLCLVVVQSKIEITPPSTTDERHKSRSDAASAVNNVRSNSEPSVHVKTASSSSEGSQNEQAGSNTGGSNSRLGTEETPEFSPPSKSIYNEEGSELNIQSAKDNEVEEENVEENLIKIKFGPPEVIQIVPPPDLTKKLAGTEPRKEPETPVSDEPIDVQG